MTIRDCLFLATGILIGTNLEQVLTALSVALLLILAVLLGVALLVATIVAYVGAVMTLAVVWVSRQAKWLFHAKNKPFWLP